MKFQSPKYSLWNPFWYTHMIDEAAKKLEIARDIVQPHSFSIMLGYTSYFIISSILIQYNPFLMYILFVVEWWMVWTHK